MKKPIGKLTTGPLCRQAREFLGLSKTELARILRLGPVAGRKAVIRIELHGQEPPGPYQIALEAMVSGWRPWGVKLPIDKETKNAGDQ